MRETYYQCVQLSTKNVADARRYDVVASVRFVHTVRA